MKKIYLYALMSVTALAFAACTPKNEPDVPSTPSDTIFPKKHLIEEFTGQDCGYCPYGMDCVHEFIGNDSNWVLILHHYGYQKDNFSVNGSNYIKSMLSVNGAPSVAINRDKTNYEEGNAVVFHPGYLPSYVDKAQFDSTTYASIILDNTYNPATRELNVKVSGVIGKSSHKALKLTVLVKESGMVDYQSDYYNTFEGWSEFRHANAVRVFLTGPRGDDLKEDSTKLYNVEYTTTLDEKWVAENCMVVAFITEQYKPVIQAEEKPVVDGSKGGADILHGGITRVPVEDYYPEPSATTGPSDYSGLESDTLTYAVASYTPYAEYGFNYWQIQTYSSKRYVTVGGTKSIPFAQIYVFTDLNVTTLPQGSYELNLSEQPGSAYAGYRDDEKGQLGGSEFYYINYSYFTQGYLVPTAEWLIVEGTLTIGETDWTLEGKARNGSTISLVGTTAIKNNGKASAPRRQPKRSGPSIAYDLEQK